MNWKEFLKPDWRKIAIFIMVSIMLSLTPLDVSIGLQGLPLPIFVCTAILSSPFGFYYPTFFSGCPFDIIYLNLIIDLIFWYLLSCLIVWIYDKVKKK